MEWKRDETNEKGKNRRIVHEKENYKIIITIVASSAQLTSMQFETMN